MNALQEMIRARGLTQQWLAEQVGLSSMKLSLIVRGRASLPPELVRPLARLLRVPPTQVRDAATGKPPA